MGHNLWGELESAECLACILFVGRSDGGGGCFRNKPMVIASKGQAGLGKTTFLAQLLPCNCVLRWWPFRARAQVPIIEPRSADRKVAQQI